MTTISCSDFDLDRAAAHIRAGGLVGMPTETVYGLAANALDETAVRSIFEAKQRPLNDPVICHFADAESALRYAAPSPAAAPALAALATLWPAPLTLVVNAAPEIPTVVMAGGHTVGLRVPRHPVARALCARAGVPIAAPSANRFGHVSPTLPEHVMADLGHAAGLLVLDPRLGSSVGPTEVGVEVGVESTVAAVTDTGVVVLRRGGVSIPALTAALAAHGLPGPRAVHRQAAADRSAGAAPEAAPGQLLRHYAPDVPALLLAPAGAGPESETGAHTGLRAPLTSCVVLDMAGSLANLAPGAGHYRNLGATPADAARNLFDALRWAEACPGAAAVAVADPRVAPWTEGAEAGADAEAVFDRVLRATEGQAGALVNGEIVHVGSIVL